MGGLCGKTLPIGETPVAEKIGSDPPLAPEVIKPRRGSLSDLEDNRLAVAEPDALQWLNALVDAMWPHISKAVTTLVSEEVEPKIREELPAFLRSSFSLSVRMGYKQPVLGPLSVFKNTHRNLDDGPKMMIALHYDPDLEITLKLGLLTAGVKLKLFHGVCMLSLNPVLDKMPVLGGVSFYFPDVPRIDLDFEGIANIADAPGIARIVRSALEDAIANKIVLPTKQMTYWGKSITDAKGTSTTDALPVGMVRAKVVKCIGLPDDADWTIFGKQKIEPYVRVRVGHKIWDCNIGKDGTPSDSKESEVEFTVYDTMQSLCISVYDADNFTSDDLIAHHDPIRILDAMKLARSPLKLTKPTDEQAGAGTLQLQLQWMMVVNSLEDVEGCIVTVSLKQALIPADWKMPESKIRIKLGREEKVLDGILTREDDAAKEAIKLALADARKNLLDQGVKAQVVDKALRRDEEAGITVFSIQKAVWFKAEKFDPSGVLNLCIVDKDGVEVATSSVSLKDVQAANLHLPGPVWFTNKGSEEKARAEIEVRVCGIYPEECGLP